MSVERNFRIDKNGMAGGNDESTYLSGEDPCDGGSCSYKFQRRRSRRGTEDSGESLSKGCPEFWIGVVAALRRRLLRPPRVAAEIEFL